MTQQALDPEAIKAAVREHYSKVVQRDLGGSCGCGAGSACCESAAGSCGGSGQDTALYTTEELAQFPADVAGSSWGCGNPTALTTLRPGEVVLDLGSGGGLDVFLAAGKVGRDGKAYGLDAAVDMVALASANAHRMGFQNVEFLHGKMEAIPLPDSSVDVVISNCVISMAADKTRVLSEVARVMRPGGRVAVTDIVTRLPVPPMLKTSLKLWALCVAGAITEDEYRRQLAA